jgi:hypothetical protein
MSFLASRARAVPGGFGRPLKRQEDPRLITGRGRFSDDFTRPGQAHACFGGHFVSKSGERYFDPRYS